MIHLAQCSMEANLSQVDNLAAGHAMTAQREAERNAGTFSVGSRFGQQVQLANNDCRVMTRPSGLNLRGSVTVDTQDKANTNLCCLRQIAPYLAESSMKQDGARPSSCPLAGSSACPRRCGSNRGCEGSPPARCGGRSETPGDHRGRLVRTPDATASCPLR